MTGVIKARSEYPFHYLLVMSILGIAELNIPRLAVGLVSPFNLIYIVAGLVDLIARALGYKYDIFHSTTVLLEILSRSPLSSAVCFLPLDMDNNKKEERSRGGPPVTSQHHTEDMTPSLQDRVSCDQKALTTHLLADHSPLIIEQLPGSRSSRRGGKKSTRYCDVFPFLAAVT